MQKHRLGEIDYHQIFNQVVAVVRKYNILNIGSPTFEIAYLSESEGEFNHSSKQIRIKPLSKSKFIRVLCHELYHAHQDTTGSLKVENGVFFWQGVAVKKSYAKTRMKKIMDQPWEREAYFFEDQILAKIRRHLNETCLCSGTQLDYTA